MANPYALEKIAKRNVMILTLSVWLHAAEMQSVPPGAQLHGMLAIAIVQVVRQVRAEADTFVTIAGRKETIVSGPPREQALSNSV
jgi:hypothetical protein